MSAKTLTVMAVVVFVSSSVAAQDEGASPCQCTLLVTTGVLVTAFVILAVFGLFLFIKRRTRAEARKPDPEAAVRAAYSNPSFEEDNTDGGAASSSRHPSAIVLVDPATSSKPRDKGLSTLERVMAAVKLSSRDLPTRTLDDTGSVGAGEEAVVPLRATDFAGLGFTVAGTLRDGIYVKDLLNKGPAALSGNVKPGDRLVALTVVTEHCAQDDALNLLSYASPYPVLLHLVKNSATRQTGLGMNLSTLSSSPSNLSASEKKASAPSASMPVHPSFRSQSSGDLTSIAPGDDRKASSGLKLGGCIESPHTRISDSAINQLAGCQLTRSKMQGRHSERAIDVPETALKPSSAYGKLHPSSHSIQDVVNDIQGNDSESRETMSKLGVKVLPDLPSKSQTNTINIEQIDVEKGSEIFEEAPKTGETAEDGLVHMAVQVTHPIVEIHSEMNGAMLKNDDVQDEVSLDTERTLNNDSEPNNGEQVCENEDVISNSATNLPSVVDNFKNPSDRDQIPGDLRENTITSRSVVRELQTYAPTSDLTIPMMTDDEASRPTSEIEPEQNTVLSFSVPETDPNIQAIRPRTDDEKQNARRSLGFEFIGMRNFHRDSSAMEESPECDENKIRMDAASSTLSAEVLETVNRAAFDVDDYSAQTGSENTIDDQDVENTSGFAMTNLNLIRNKTDQIKDEEHLAINLTSNVAEQQDENVELENSDTEDDAAMRIRVYEREFEPASSTADETAQFSSQRDVIRSRPLKRVAVRRVSSPNDRSSIFGMYVNHDFNKISDSPTENMDYCDEDNSAVTGTKPKIIASMASASRSNQEECFSSAFTRNDSFGTAKQFFTTKSEVELTTDIQKDHAENREYTTEKLITTSFDTRVNLPDFVVESVDAGTFETFNDPGISEEKLKISLLNFEISKPKRSTLEIEMKGSSESKDQRILTYRTSKSDSIEVTNEGNEIGNPLKNKIESDLPEADSDLNNASHVTRVLNLTDKMSNKHSAAGAECEGVVSNDTTADEAEGFGVAFGFKGFKKRIGRGEFISKNDDENYSGDSNEPGNTNESKCITVNEVGKTSVSSLKMSFEQLRGSEEEVRSSAGLQIEDLPESEASFSRAYDASQNQSESSYIDDAISSHSSEMGEREPLQNEEISLNIRGDLDLDYDTCHGASDDTKFISSIQENSKEGSKRVSRFGSKNRSDRLSNPEYVSFGNRDEIDEEHGSPTKKLKQSQSFGFKQKITEHSFTIASVDGRRSSVQGSKMAYESRPIPHYIDSKRRIFFENRDRMDSETQLHITKCDLEPRILTSKIVAEVNDENNEKLSNDDRELLNNNDETSGQKQSSKIHNRQRTPDSADDSDEEMLSLAAAAAIANRRPKSAAISGLNPRILNTNSVGTETDTFRQYIDSLVTGSVDVQIPPDGASKFEVVENIQAVRIDNEADLVPVSVTGLNPVTISGTFLDENCDNSFNLCKEADDSAPFNMIRIASEYKVLQKSQSHSNFERHAKMNDANVVSIQQIQMKQNGSGSDTENDQITISNTRRSLTDSEELKRKAASLGDLSQIPDRQDESVLERAVSLEFGSTNEHHSSSPLHKHRINLPTSSVTSVDEEEERESLTLQKKTSIDENNKKITKWGKLEDAILLRHHTGKEALLNGNGNLVSVQTYRHRDYKASSLEGIPSSVERSNSTKLEVNQPNVTVRSNPTLSMSTVEVPATNLEVNFNAKSINEIETPEGGPISNIEISGDHGVSITSLSHSASTWVRDEEENPPALPSSPAPSNSTSTRDMLGATMIRVLENSPTTDSRVLVVEKNHDYEDQTFVPHSKQKQNSLLLNSKNFINDSESEVTVTTVLGSGKTSFITGSSPPDLVPPKNISHEGDWVHTNGDIINVSRHDVHNLAHLENNRNESSKGMTHSDRENDSGYLSHPSDPDQIMQMSMTQIRVDGTRLDYSRDNKRLSRTLVIPPPGTSAAICITQPDSPPPFLQPPN